MNGCVAELERLLLTGKSQMRVTEPFRGNWARAETADGSYKLTDWTHAIRIVQTQGKSTVAFSSESPIMYRRIIMYERLCTYSIHAKLVQIFPGIEDLVVAPLRSSLEYYESLNTAEARENGDKAKTKEAV